MDIFAENWQVDYLWARNNAQQSGAALAAQDEYSDQSWSTFLRSSWSPTPWSPSTNQSHRSSLDNGIAMGQFGNNFSSLSESENLLNHGLHSPNLSMGSIGQASGILNQGHFAQNTAPQLTRGQPGETSVTSSVAVSSKQIMRL